MIRQYHAQRRRGGPNPLGVGVIPVGAIFYIQDEGWWRDRYRGAATCRNPWIVEAFLNGTIGAARRNRQTGPTWRWSARCATGAAARSPCAPSSFTRSTGCRSGRAPIRICPTCACGGCPILVGIA